MLHEGVADPELSFHPEIAELRTLIHEGLYARHVGETPGLRVAPVVAPEDTHFLGPQPVEEER